MTMEIENITWREVLNVKPDATGGQILRALRKRNQFEHSPSFPYDVADDFARLCKITKTDLFAYETGKKEITEKLAKVFAKVFGTSYKVFLVK